MTTERHKAGEGTRGRYGGVPLFESLCGTTGCKLGAGCQALARVAARLDLSRSAGEVKRRGTLRGRRVLGFYLICSPIGAVIALLAASGATGGDCAAGVGSTGS